MKLISLPDCKKLHAKLTLGKQYTVIRDVSNCVVIELDDSSDQIIILRERFEP